MKHLLAAFLLMAVCSSAMAEWVFIGTTEDQSSTIYGDPATRRRAGDVVKVWILTNYAKPRKSPNGFYTSAKIQKNVDCKEERMRNLALVAYKGAMGIGDIDGSENTPNSDWSPVVPDSLGESISQWACAK